MKVSIEGVLFDDSDSLPNTVKLREDLVLNDEMAKQVQFLADQVVASLIHQIPDNDAQEDDIFSIKIEIDYVDMNC